MGRREGRIRKESRKIGLREGGRRERKRREGRRRAEGDESSQFHMTLSECLPEYSKS